LQLWRREDFVSENSSPRPKGLSKAQGLHILPQNPKNAIAARATDMTDKNLKQKR
jgi:hypothetical protein